jgi:hypothetical protein
LLEIRIFFVLHMASYFKRQRFFNIYEYKIKGVLGKNLCLLK